MVKEKQKTKSEEKVEKEKPKTSKKLSKDKDSSGSKKTKISEKVESDISDKEIKKSKEKKAPEKKEKKERIGVLNIYTTFNNTMINLTDLAGTSVAKFSGGGSTKQDRLKANPTVAMFIAQRVAEEAKDHGFTGFYVKIRAKTGQANPGPGAHSAVKSLTRAGFKILSIMDNTRIPRGGPKKKGGRRGRRP